MCAAVESPQPYVSEEDAVRRMLPVLVMSIVALVGAQAWSYRITRTYQFFPSLRLQLAHVRCCIDFATPVRLSLIHSVGRDLVRS